MRVDEGFDNKPAGRVEQIGIRTAIAVVGVGRACGDGTEVRVFYVDVPSSLSASESRISDDHSATSSSRTARFHDDRRLATPVASSPTATASFRHPKFRLPRSY